MRRTLLVIGLLFAATTSAAAKPTFSGAWEFVHKCSEYRDSDFICGHGPGAYGPPDIFALQMMQRGQYVCGTLLSTARLGHSVDSTRFIGRVRAGVATVIFGSSHGEASLRGTGTIQIRAGRLHWKVTKPLPIGDTWPSASAEPARWNEDTEDQLRDWCRYEWDDIEGQHPEGVDLGF